MINICSKSYAGAFPVSLPISQYCQICPNPGVTHVISSIVGSVVLPPMCLLSNVSVNSNSVTKEGIASTQISRHCFGTAKLTARPVGSNLSMV